MKNNFFSLYVLILAVFVSSCSKQRVATLLPELEHVETIMYQYPDSALRILEQMRVPKSSNHLNHATWCLFLAQAKYKNYIKQPSDSLINIAYDYFMGQDNSQRKALALYLEGAINEELNEVEKAATFYLKAGDEVGQTTDYQLGHLIFLGLGQIYIYRELYDYAESMIEKSHTYAELSENQRYIASSLLLKARLYSILGNLDKSIKYYKKAIQKLNHTESESYAGRIMIEMSNLYKNKEDYVSALQYAMKGAELKSEHDPDFTPNYLTVGDIYRLLGKTDSAYYYLNKAVESENIYTKRSTYGALFLLSRSRGKYEEALGYVEQYQLYSDSVQKMDRANSIIEIQEKYNKEKLLNEKNQLKIERDRTSRTALLILILLFCIIAVIVYSYQRRLLHKGRTIQKNEEQLRLYTLKIHENEALISRNKQRIDELSEEMEQDQEIQELLEEQKHAILEIQKQNEVLRDENETLQKNVCNYSSTLQERSKELELLNILSEENLRLQDRERFLSNQLIKRTKILNDLKTSPKFLDFAYWEEVKEAVDWLYENYTKRLTKKLPSLTESDLQICCLIKLHLTIPEIATLLGISPTSVSKRKFRLKERIIQEQGEPLREDKTLDLWLWEY